jgi:hypothetical protein
MDSALHVHGSLTVSHHSVRSRLSHALPNPDTNPLCYPSISTGTLCKHPDKPLVDEAIKPSSEWGHACNTKNKFWEVSKETFQFHGNCASTSVTSKIVANNVRKYYVSESSCSEYHIRLGGGSGLCQTLA